jgi:hypothetical protein
MAAIENLERSIQRFGKECPKIWKGVSEDWKGVSEDLESYRYMYIYPVPVAEMWLPISEP